MLAGQKTMVHGASGRASDAQAVLAPLSKRFSPDPGISRDHEGARFGGAE
jgi:hypothetical protein